MCIEDEYAVQSVEMQPEGYTVPFRHNERSVLMEEQHAAVNNPLGTLQEQPSLMEESNHVANHGNLMDEHHAYVEAHIPAGHNPSYREQRRETPLDPPSSLDATTFGRVPPHSGPWTRPGGGHGYDPFRSTAVPEETYHSTSRGLSIVPIAMVQNAAHDFGLPTPPHSSFGVQSRHPPCVYCCSDATDTMSGYHDRTMMVSDPAAPSRDFRIAMVCVPVIYQPQAHCSPLTPYSSTLSSLPRFRHA